MKFYLEIMGKNYTQKVQHDKEPEAFSTRIFAHMNKSN